jgi:O-acetyl-ADP-ribose deacetylase (regulator of RNase III)
MVSKMINACNDRGVISVTFPLISTKLYKFPPKESAIAIIKKVITYIYLERNPDDPLLEIHLIHESKDLLDYMAAQIDIT